MKVLNNEIILKPTHMKKFYLKFLCNILIVLLLSYTPVKAQISLPYLGQTPPGLTPELFAPGIVSTAETKEWSLTFSFDGTEMFFYRIDDAYFCTLYTCKFEDNSWTLPVEAEFSSQHSASEPCFTIDDQKLYFMWNDGSSQIPNYYFVNRTEDGWSTPVLAGQGMWLCTDGNGQLYTTDLSVLFTTGKSYLAKVITENGVFSSYERLLIQPSYGNQAHPCIAHDQSFIIFDVDGGKDLYVSFKNNDDNWDTAIRLADHGFDANSGGAYISPCGKYLFFQMNYDIYWVNIDVINNLNPYIETDNKILNAQKESIIFPNPTYGKITLKNQKNTFAEIIDMSGNILLSFNINNGNTEIDISNYAHGLYLIKLTSEEYSKVEHIIKY